MIIERLSEKDIKELKYQCRMGYILPAIILILSTFIGGVVYELNFNTDSTNLNIEIDSLITLASLITSMCISYLMNRKFYSDINGNEKIAETKKITKKIAQKDFEAGSATVYIGQEMNEFIRYDLVIDKTKHRIDKELYDSCEEGDEIILYYAPKSQYLLGMKKK